MLTHLNGPNASSRLIVLVNVTGEGVELCLFCLVTTNYVNVNMSQINVDKLGMTKQMVTQQNKHFYPSWRGEAVLSF